MSSQKAIGFSQLGLSDAVVRAVDEVGYETPTPIQSAAIAALLEGRDILGQAQTGTGKTAAFALPLLSRLNLELTRPQILVLTPTRELAIQVAEALQTYARYLPGFHVLPVYGGQSLTLQLRPLRRGVHAVVGTPGRILDHLRRRTLVLDALTGVVLDEADEMLRMGFIDDVGSILESTPKKKQLALFSATLPEPIRAIARRHTHNAVEIRIESATTTVSTVSQHYWQVTGVHKLDALTRILEVADFDAMLIFVRTKTSTTDLAERLEARGFPSAALNGDMTQANRELTVERLRSGRLDILVATDVAARGLDVTRISHVVNFDIPYDTEAYVHRIGRTARAGRKGEAILFVAPRERRMLRAIERATGQTITPMTIPSRADVVDKRATRFKAKITEVIESQDLTSFESLIAGYQGEHNVEVGQIAAALAYLLQSGQTPTLTQSDDQGGEKLRQKSAAREFPERGDGAGVKKKEANKGCKREARGTRQDSVSGAESESKRYRIEVGAAHGVEPKNIVGAIANEAGLASQYISSIDIHEDYSTVDLPGGMPKAIFKHLRQVWVCGQRLMISLDSSAQGEHEPARSRSDKVVKSASETPAKSKRRKPLIADTESVSTPPGLPKTETNAVATTAKLVKADKKRILTTRRPAATETNSASAKRKTAKTEKKRVLRKPTSVAKKRVRSTLQD